MGTSRMAQLLLVMLYCAYIKLNHPAMTVKSQSCELKLQNLSSWLISEGGFVSPSINCHYRKLPNHAVLRGLGLASDVEAGAMLAAIPKKCTITPIFGQGCLSAGGWWTGSRSCMKDIEQSMRSSYFDPYFASLISLNQLREIDLVFASTSLLQEFFFLDAAQTALQLKTSLADEEDFTLWAILIYKIYALNYPGGSSLVPLFDLINSPTDLFKGTTRENVRHKQNSSHWLVESTRRIGKDEELIHCGYCHGSNSVLASWANFFLPGNPNPVVPANKTACYEWTMNYQETQGGLNYERRNFQLQLLEELALEAGCTNVVAG